MEAAGALPADGFYFSSKKLCWDPALLTRLTHDLTPYFQAAQPCTGERAHSE